MVISTDSAPEREWLTIKLPSALPDQIEYLRGLVDWERVSYLSLKYALFAQSPKTIEQQAEALLKLDSSELSEVREIVSRHPGKYTQVEGAVNLIDRGQFTVQG